MILQFCFLQFHVSGNDFLMGLFHIPGSFKTDGTTMKNGHLYHIVILVESGQFEHLRHFDIYYLHLQKTFKARFVRIRALDLIYKIDLS